MTTLWRHRQTRREISCIVSVHAKNEESGQGCSYLDERLIGEIDTDQIARTALIEHSGGSARRAAKAEHIHLLLVEGEGAFDSAKLDVLLQSFSLTEETAQPR